VDGRGLAQGRVGLGLERKPGFPGRGFGR
jgi:hypothetical protein